MLEELKLSSARGYLKDRIIVAVLWKFQSVGYLSYCLKSQPLNNGHRNTG
jgi:hypothetical protein